MRSRGSAVWAPSSASVLTLFVLLGGAATSAYLQVEAAIYVNSPARLEQSFQFNSSASELDPFDLLLEDVVPTWLGSRWPNNQAGAYQDVRGPARTHDDAWQATIQHLISRSGFRYKLYDAVARDGYTSQLTHLINPLADARKLRRPPVLVELGEPVGPAAYLLANSIQLAPEKYPHAAGRDASWRTENRSLAFYLANSGYDVWLAETRASNERNKRLIKTRTFESFVSSKLRNMTSSQQLSDALQSIEQWSYSRDDIIAHELRSHIDAVLNLTQSSKVNLVSSSLSASNSLAFFGLEPTYTTNKVHGYVSIAPIATGREGSKVLRTLVQTLCPLVADEVSTILLADVLFEQPARELLQLVARNTNSRNTFLKTLDSLLEVTSGPKWQTLLDLNLAAHLLKRLSFKEFKQMCQQIASDELRRFDYGPERNKALYNSLEPPAYNISQLNIQDWMLVSGANDALATPQTIARLYAAVNPKPTNHLMVPNFNHLDLFVGQQNDVSVNEPIRQYLERKTQQPYSQDSQSGATGARSLEALLRSPDLGALLNPLKLLETASSGISQTVASGATLGGAVGNTTEKPPSGPVKIIETITKTIHELMMGNLFGKLFPPRLVGLIGVKGSARSLELAPTGINSLAQGVKADDGASSSKEEANIPEGSAQSAAVLKPPVNTPPSGLLGGVKKAPGLGGLMANNITRLFDLTKILDTLGSVGAKAKEAAGSQSLGGKGLAKLGENLSDLAASRRRQKSDGAGDQADSLRPKLPLLGGLNK